jgi:hypothetical protein
MRQTKGKLYPFGFIPVLREMKTTDTLEMILVAVRQDLQGMGLNAVIMNEVMKGALRHNMKFAETGPELEVNAQVQSQWKLFDKVEQHRRRRCYVKNL